MSNTPNAFGNHDDLPDFDADGPYIPYREPAPVPTPLPTPEPAPVRLHPAVAEVRALLAEYGEFVRHKDKARELLDTLGDRYPRYEQIDTLRTTIRDTKRELRKMESFVPEDPVDWSDHHIEHAIRTLTALDDDRASKANKLGWGKNTSPIGHYVYALLVRGDRDRAIEIARGIVRHHRKQLEKRVVRSMYPLPTDWIRGAAK